MAEGPGPRPDVARRLDPQTLSPEQLRSVRSAETALWTRNLPQRRTRNLITGIAIGAIVLGIYGYTFYAVSQERFLDKLEEEAKVARARASPSG
ncbi:cytochrome c oxidase assembly factor 3 homolog, mitochondrial [Callorhinchus milii]|uniref:Cytochrome c oxidase assembly factor 3 n=1 Tax=Callorhinchus milii TaxID=7868 RepID=V9LJV0_CALMI|nr:cytochrome c oxidase assembly factor 3 homolog, mitochondrial [Callorhinchus milii]